MKMKSFRKNLPLLLFVIPGALWYLVMSYLPMFGITLAFKDFRIVPGNNFFQNLVQSQWVGLRNFEFLFKSSDAWIIVRNTLGYNFVFIVLGLVIPLLIAIALHEILNKRLAKIYQSALFLPYFLSWVVVSYSVFIFLSPDKGFANSILQKLGSDPVSWYNSPQAWPYVLVFVNTWKNVGYNTVIFLASITGIDSAYYEAAMLDGASKWEQIKNITIPMLSPVIIILFILSIGNIFRADFGLFYQVPMNSGPLIPVTNVVDTYVYRALMNSGNIAMSSAAGLFQSIVGFVLILTSNKIVKRYDPDKAMF